MGKQARADAAQLDLNKASGKKLHDDVMKVKQGNSASYLLRRLARHVPEILGHYKQGEFKSARAAALARGIIPRFEGKGFRPRIRREIWDRTAAQGIEKFATEPKATPSTSRLLKNYLVSC